MAKLTKEQALLVLETLKERSDYKTFFKKYFKIRDRETSEMIPFTVNSSQAKLLKIIEDWEKQKIRKTLFIVILKARRQGFSTCTEAVFFKKIMYEKNRTAMIVSYDEDSANNINEMSGLFYQYLPDDRKPARRMSRSKGILLENPKYDPSSPSSDENDPGLQSKFLIETARNMNAGSSFNLHYLHLSELAKWEGDIPRTMTSILQAVPSTDSIVVVESTALGYNYFKDLWDDSCAYDFIDGNRVKRNDYIPLFIPWFEDKGSVMKYKGFRLEGYEHPVYGNEVEIKKTFKLTNDQMQWRRWCIENKCNRDLNTFKQEFPASPNEAFVATGSPVFPNATVERRKAIEDYYTVNDLVRGRFEYEKSIEEDRITILPESIKFVEDENGYIEVFDKPLQGYPYVIGVDTSGDGSDYSAGVVVNNNNGMQSAVIHGKINSDIFAELLYCLGKYYNDAMIAIESNFDYLPIEILDKLNYWNLYRRKVIDKIGGGYQNKYGFRTTSITRPLIINNLVTIVRDDIELFNHTVTLEEMLTFARNKTGRPEAMSGKRDDLVMANAIAYYCREQMWSTIDDYEEPDNVEYDEDDEEVRSINWLTQ